MLGEQETIETIRQKNELLEQKLQYLETVIELHNICTFEENLHKFKLNVRSGLRQVAAEFQAMEYDPENAERVHDLIDYLQHVIAELERFLYPAAAQDESEYMGGKGHEDA